MLWFLKLAQTQRSWCHQASNTSCSASHKHTGGEITGSKRSVPGTDLQSKTKFKAGASLKVLDSIFPPDENNLDTLGRKSILFLTTLCCCIRGSRNQYNNLNMQSGWRQKLFAVFYPKREQQRTPTLPGNVNDE